MLNQETDKVVRVSLLWNALLGPIILSLIIGLFAVWLLSQGIDQLVENENEVNPLAKIVGSSIYDRLSDQMQPQHVYLAAFFIAFAGAGIIGLWYLFNDEYLTAVKSNDFESAIKNASYLFLLPPSLPITLGFIFILIKTKAFQLFVLFIMMTFIGVLWNYIYFHKVYSTLMEMARGKTPHDTSTSQKQETQEHETRKAKKVSKKKK
ncbi:MAG: hypothetical protein N3E37_01405 [Candidatus Micrarchaeota archaeon]|nr:hypothetical protein [Candidatus Micrarchaeota archaeon]